jgi:FKBP-type peptidyl-prolyl cis-trans isomerase
VRIRPIAALSAAALAALLLAGCSSSPAPTASPSPSASAAADLCSAAAAGGDAVKTVKVTGDVGSEATATFNKPLTVSKIQRTVITEGTGKKVKAGDLVQYALTAYNTETGAKLGSVGYKKGEVLPSQISADSPLGQVFGCAPVGTRVVAAFPSSETAPGEVYVLDLLKVVPAKAWGADQSSSTGGMPTVKLAKDGEPSIAIPKGTTAPTQTKIVTLKKGDGATVASGDQVLVQYKGVLWSDGKEFDSSWKRGTPASFQTTGVVKGFQKALEGQTVGSQVIVVIPPAEGYGTKAQGAIPANSTLVFVVDILGTQHTTTQ